MGESKHTRGPWVLDPPGSLRIGSGFAVKARTPEGPGFPTPSATGFYVMAEPPPHGRDKQAEQEANARLIAAAPELLAIAVKVLPLLEATQRMMAAEAARRGMEPDDTLLNEIRAAIAKAEGTPTPNSTTLLSAVSAEGE